MKELAVRTLTSLLFVALLVTTVLGHAWASFGVFLLFSVIASREYALLLKNEGEVRSSLSLSLTSGILAFLILSFSFLLDLPGLLLGLPLLFPLALLIGLFTKESRPFRNAAIKCIGPVHFGLSFACLIGIREHEAGGPYILLGVLMLVWVHDSAAYLFGKMLGRRKLWPSISPGKTWEGSIAGTLFAFLLSWGLSYFHYPGWSEDGFHLLRILFPILVVLLGTLGDLSISKFKRELDIKDTGNILPGHGGVLDRFDALLMSAPFLLFLLELSGY